MAAKKKKEKPVTLETVLWNCRVALRGIGSLEKNRDAVIGLVFLKFAGEKFLQRREEIAVEYAEKPAGLIEILREEPASYAKKNVFYLPETCRWSYLRQHASDNDIAVKLDKAMQDIEHSNAALKGALQHNLYASLGAANSKLKSLIDEVDKISNYRMKEDDLIGRVYEYFLRIYAASGKKEDGEFYTPASAVKLIAALIEPLLRLGRDVRAIDEIRRCASREPHGGLYSRTREQSCDVAAGTAESREPRHCVQSRRAADVDV